MSGSFDRLPMWAGHAVIAFAGGVLATILQGLLTGPGNVPLLIGKAVISGVVASAATVATLYVTPLTTRYGSGGSNEQ
jgi:hypothetical protein